ncbi:isoamylase 2 chloroplastic [Prunus yedoensis var. nudiflora]|uniref:Isoamylase 2 chloroplastic n=1 Tax=Prunus yedoensis var. nudiflora TaxID=2094558 RepID=A0A314ZH32_PRUYE|nr:isoamylase 2 chloroplastic [Prunus yedoensis var. nudiflora]
MGDECGQSTGGSPAYSDRKAFDWNALETGFATQTTQFIAFLSSFRKRRSDLLQKRNFLKEENIYWYESDQTPPRWEDPSCKFLAMRLKADIDEVNQPGDESSHSRGDLFVAFNAADHSETVVLPPPPEGMGWRCWSTQLFHSQVFSLLMVSPSLSKWWVYLHMNEVYIVVLYLKACNFVS